MSHFLAGFNSYSFEKVERRKRLFNTLTGHEESSYMQIEPSPRPFQSTSFRMRFQIFLKLDRPAISSTCLVSHLDGCILSKDHNVSGHPLRGILEHSYFEDPLPSEPIWNKSNAL